MLQVVVKIRIIRIQYKTIAAAVAFILVAGAAFCFGLHSQTVSGRVKQQTPGEQQQNAMGLSQPEIDLPILMYHSILKDPGRAGTYVLSPNTFENDLDYLASNGYTTILMQDLIDYVYNDKPLPEKPIMITFDDGYFNNYYYVFPILKERQVKAIISPIAYQSEKFTNTPDPNPNYAHLTWENLKEMQDSGLVEIQNHSYNMHSNDARKGARICSGESKEAYQKVFVEDAQKAQDLLTQNVGFTPTVYAYPFGSFCGESEELIKQMGFKGSFITQDKNNTITKDPESLYKLSRYNRPANISTEEFMKRIVPKEK